MSELQISLLAIGALVILAVFAYNKWQERKLARGAEDNFRSRHEDVLLKRPGTAANPDSSATRTSDLRPTPAHPVDQREAGELPRIEPVIRTQVGAPVETVTLTLAPAPILDYVIDIDFAESVQGDLITSTSELALLPRARWDGFTQDTMLWQTIRADVLYQRVRAGLQMVSRQGVIQLRDLELFSAAVSATGQRLGGAVSAADPVAALAHARELDTFCGEVDVQIAIHLVSRDGVSFAGTKLRALAEAAGMSLGTDKQFSYRNDDGLIQYSLANKEAQAFQAEVMRDLSTRGVSLLLDVPRAPGGTASFRAMVILAKRLSQSLDAAIIDDNGNALGERAFDAIATQLAALYRSMEARGISAGSAIALRLFS